MSRPTPPHGLHRLPRVCWTLTAYPPALAGSDEYGPGAQHFPRPADAVSWYLGCAETDPETTGPRGAALPRFRTHLYPWPVGGRCARRVAELAVTTTTEPCWILTCTQCDTVMDGDTGVLHVAEVDRAVIEAAAAGWALRGGRLSCEYCAGRASLAEVLDIEARDRLDPHRRPSDPDQLALPGFPGPRRDGGRS